MFLFSKHIYIFFIDIRLPVFLIFIFWRKNTHLNKTIDDRLGTNTRKTGPLLDRGNVDDWLFVQFWQYQSSTLGGAFAECMDFEHVFFSQGRYLSDNINCLAGNLNNTVKKEIHPVRDTSKVIAKSLS